MSQHVILSTLFLNCFASLVVGQDTRTFPEAECAYTLPGDDWEWVDPKLVQLKRGQTLAVTRNKVGLVFTLRFEPLQEGEKPTSRSYESFEHGFIEAGKYKKLASRHLSFRGIPSYHFDVETPDRRGASLRLMYASNRFYHLQISNAAGLFDPKADLEPIFQGFTFTTQPQPMPMPPSDLEQARERGQAVGQAMNILMMLGAFAAIVIFIVLYVQRKEKQKRNHRPLRRPSD